MSIEETELYPEQLPDARVLTTNEFTELLGDLCHAIEHGDSLEGNLQYEASEPGKYRVKGAYRVGNREGQGGVRIISASVPGG